MVSFDPALADATMTSAPRPRAQLHPYQVAAIDFLEADAGRQVIAVMGSGKTTIALHAITDLKQVGGLDDDPVLVVAPLLIAETVWHVEAAAWQETSALTIERVVGTAKQRLAALDRLADIYVTNYDNIRWLAAEIARRGWRFSVLIADEASRLKNPGAARTKTMLALGLRAARRWTLTGTPRGHQLTDMWAPAQFVTQGTAFPPFYAWRAANFFPVDLYERQFYPRTGVEVATIDRLRPFTFVVDEAALSTRPPVQEIIHDVPLDPATAAVYQALEIEGSTASLIAKLAGDPSLHLLSASEKAIVTKLMQVTSGAVYDDNGGWQRLHDRRLDMLAEIHEGHDRPTLVFVTYRHEIARIQQRFPAAQLLSAEKIDAWNNGGIDLLIAHPASAGHGINLQHGSDTLVWFSLPWSAELFQQANARLARQGQRSTVTIHILLSRGYIDEIAYRVVARRIVEQDRLITALRVPA
jgi:SNF2 family DNA or RNA helicase